jgi:hypothetical protein
MVNDNGKVLDLEIKDRYMCAFMAPNGQVLAVYAKKMETLKDGFWFNEDTWVPPSALMYIERLSQKALFEQYHGKIREITDAD